eukprot:11137525-Ditylum_brightwellii.AAC.1
MKDKHKYIPGCLLVYPDLKQSILGFYNNNLGDFNINIVHLYINKYADIIVKNDAMFLTIYDGNSSSKEVSNIRIENKNRNVGEIRSICSADSLHAKFIQATSKIMHKEEISKTSIKNERNYC